MAYWREGVETLQEITKISFSSTEDVGGGFKIRSCSKDEYLLAIEAAFDRLGRIGTIRLSLRSFVSVSGLKPFSKAKTLQDSCLHDRTR